MKEGNEVVFAFICTYSFDDDVAVYLCKTEAEAVDMLRQTYKDEVQSDTENGHEFEASISDDGWKAEIINYRSSGDVDHTWYRIGHVYK